jgi:hypothetical protein
LHAPFYTLQANLFLSDFLGGIIDHFAPEQSYNWLAPPGPDPKPEPVEEDCNWLVETVV